MIRGLILVSIYLLSLAAMLFFSAGRADWPMGWATLGVYIVISVLAFVLVDPELVKERSRLRSGTKSADMVLASLSFLFFFPLTLLVSGLDVGRFGWSPPFPHSVQLTALVVFAMGNAFGCWAMVSNKYFSTFVRIQTDRGHEVVTRGPYRIVRHPGYAGTILAVLALPLSLGSLWALIPAAIGAFGFVIRTWIEDKSLLKGLGGYGRYAARVRYRLIPGLW